MEFGPEILGHNGVYFATTNNSYDQCLRESGEDGLLALFQETVWRKTNWSVRRSRRPSHLPTCEQAEVLYPERLGVEYLRRVYVADEELYDVVGGWCREFDFPHVEVLQSGAKFGGCPN